LASLRALSSSNGYNVGNGGGERGVESAGGRIGSGLVVGDSVISGSDHDGHSLSSELLSGGAEAVGAGGILFGFDSSVADAVDKRGSGGVLNGDDPLEENISFASDGPEPSGRSLGNSHDVLDVEVSFDAVVGIGVARGRLVSSDDFGDGLSGEAELGLEALQIRWRKILLQGLEQRLSSLGAGDGITSDFVERAQESGSGDSAGVGAVGVVSELNSSGRELNGVSDEIDVESDESRNGVGQCPGDGLFLRLRHEVVELSAQHLLSDVNGHGRHEIISIKSGMHI